MYHNFLIHSSADGHLGCFHVLAIINSAVMNIGVHVSLPDLEIELPYDPATPLLVIPTAVFLPGESQGQRNLVGCCLWGHTGSDVTEVT